MSKPRRLAESTGAEDLFVDIFQEAVGIDTLSSLGPQYPVRDIYGGPRYIDYALIGRYSKYAFEVDGEYSHRPDSPRVTTEKFRDDLLRQNSLVHFGWKVFRWSDGQLAEEREKVKEEIRLFLQDDLRNKSFDGYLPKQRGEEFELREHQEEALEFLDCLRRRGKTIALLTHPTGTGKTLTAISDAKRLGKRTLYIAHRQDLVTQTLRQFEEHWPEVACAAYSGGATKPDAFVVGTTFQALYRNLGLFSQEEFEYLIADEAHHVPAPTFKRTIGHFRARFTLGMTATPERTDNQPLLEMFEETLPRLELKEAIEKGLLSPVRCVRVKTNVDLTHLRYNGSDYRSADLETGLFIPERNALIVQAYTDHVRGKPGVTFCVNVAHSVEMARLYREAGVPAEAVSGRMSGPERQNVLDRYEAGELVMLCACDLLNEGWDSPKTEVLMMARPTLSRVLYVQQLGRGTRLYPGKECLYVFDFIDNTIRYAQSLNVHRLFGMSSYRPGALVAAPPDAMTEEQGQLEAGNSPTPIALLGLYISAIEEVDIFDWKSEVAGMLTTADLEIELGVGGGTAAGWVRTGKLTPDHSVPLGRHTYHYFRKERVPEIGKQLIGEGWTPPKQRNKRVEFLRFVAEMDMSSSYKPVMLLALLDSVDSDGHCRVADIVRRFQEFYVDRARSGRPVELGRNRMKRVAEMSQDEVGHLVFEMPFEKFERRHFLKREKDVAWVKFDRKLWKSLGVQDLDEIRQTALSAIDEYYARADNDPTT